MKTTSKSLTKRHQFAYALGDLGGCMTFGIMGSFLLPYYTDVAGLSAASVATMFLVLKIWDAINDPLMGTLLDKLFAKSKNKGGKFRPWMIRTAPIVAITAILMFNIPTGMGLGAKLVWAYVTYLLYEASYTMFNVPYCSLISAMAIDETERAKLSSARGLGSIVGNLLPTMTFPIIINSFSANPSLGYSLGIAVCATIGFVACLLSGLWGEERIDPPAVNAEDVSYTDVLQVLRTNRSFWGISITAMCDTIAFTVTNTLGVYLFRDVFGALPMMGLSSMVMMAFMAISMMFLPKFVNKFGLEKTTQTSMLIAIALYILLLILPSNVYLYMVVVNVALMFVKVPINLQWGMVGDVIDLNEKLTGKRSEGATYGTFNLSRRFGQAIGASAAAMVIGLVGYNAELAVQTAQTLSNIRLAVIGIPMVGAILMWVALKFIWKNTK